MESGFIFFFVIGHLTESKSVVESIEHIEEYSQDLMYKIYEYKIIKTLRT